MPTTIARRPVRESRSRATDLMASSKGDREREWSGPVPRKRTDLVVLWGLEVERWKVRRCRVASLESWVVNEGEGEEEESGPRSRLV